jgi:hypothetical protein
VNGKASDWSFFLIFNQSILMLPSENELKERYSSYSNKRLLSIVHNKDQYTAQALEAAKSELAGRNLTPAEVDIFLDEREEQELAAKVAASIPLKLWEKIFFFFLWFAGWFFTGALRMNYQEDGLLLKVRQSKVYARAGFIALLLDGILSVYFDFSEFIAVGILAGFFLSFFWLEKNVVYELVE